MLTKRLLAGPRTATTGVVVGARRRALEAGRNMMGVAREVKGGEVEEEAEERKQEEVSETTSSREWNWRRESESSG